MQNVETLNTQDLQAPTAQPAQDKPAKGTKGKKTRKTIAQDFNAQAVEIAQTWAASIDARVTKLQDRGEFVAVEWAIIKSTISAESFAVALAMLIGSQSIDTAPLSRMLPLCKWETTRENYIQAKTVQKIVNLIHTLAANDLHKLSDYTSQVLYAALHNGDALSIPGALASLSKRVSNVDLPNGEQVTKRGSYSTGTASAQASQVRMLLGALGLAQVTKGKKGDTFVLDATRVQNLRALYDLQAV